MKIGIIQASSQKSKNNLLYDCVKNVAEDKGHEVINFGVFQDEEDEFSYIEIAICISILLESKVVDFIITGCSSGQGMMLACNSLPNILCGYIENPSDAYLFGRINNGNAISFPLGLNFGWAGEINLKCTLEKLFDEPFGVGYPKEDATRKQEDTKMLKVLNNITKRSLAEVLPKLNLDLLKHILKRDNIYDYIIKNSENEELKVLLRLYR